MDGHPRVRPMRAGGAGAWPRLGVGLAFLLLMSGCAAQILEDDDDVTNPPPRTSAGWGSNSGWTWWVARLKRSRGGCWRDPGFEEANYDWLACLCKLCGSADFMGGLLRIGYCSSSVLWEAVARPSSHAGAAQLPPADGQEKGGGP